MYTAVCPLIVVINNHYSEIINQLFKVLFLDGTAFNDIFIRLSVDVSTVCDTYKAQLVSIIENCYLAPETPVQPDC